MSDSHKKPDGGKPAPGKPHKKITAGDDTPLGTVTVSMDSNLGQDNPAPVPGGPDPVHAQFTYFEGDADNFNGTGTPKHVYLWVPGNHTGEIKHGKTFPNAHMDATDTKRVNGRDYSRKI
jgi:hypothetical protein